MPDKETQKKIWQDSDYMYQVVSFLQNAVVELEKHNWSKEDFIEDMSFQSACSFYSIQIGQYAKGFSQEFRKKYSDSLWKNLAGVRDVYAHAYHQFNEEIAWDTLTKNYPSALKKCLEICEENHWEIPPLPKIKKQTPLDKLVAAYEDLEKSSTHASEKFKSLVRKVLVLKDKDKNNSR